MRFDGHRYAGCRWCRGRGCLQCEGEARKAYRAAFPEGPKPIATFRLDDPADMERARRLLGPDALRRHFGPGGGGTASFEASLRAEQPPDPQPTTSTEPVMSEPGTNELLPLATTALRDLSMDWPPEEIASHGGKGLDELLRQCVVHLRGLGIDDEGGWDTAATAGIPVAGGGEKGVGRDETLLAIAASALRDLYMGYRPADVIALDGSQGLDELLRGLVTELRGRGIDDDGGWNCPATEGIPVGSPAPRA